MCCNSSSSSSNDAINKKTEASTTFSVRNCPNAIIYLITIHTVCIVLRSARHRIVTIRMPSNNIMCVSYCVFPFSPSFGEQKSHTKKSRPSKHKACSKTSENLVIAISVNAVSHVTDFAVVIGQHFIYCHYFRSHPLYSKVENLFTQIHSVQIIQLTLSIKSLVAEHFHQS